MHRVVEIIYLYTVPAVAGFKVPKRVLCGHCAGKPFVCLLTTFHYSPALDSNFPADNIHQTFTLDLSSNLSESYSIFLDLSLSSLSPINEH